MPDDPSNSESKAPGWSRYDRVKQILNDASGDVHPSYQGNDRFWNLPHGQLLEVTLYGIRMIAPAADSQPSGAPVGKTCCHGSAEPPAAENKQPGRGAASGLIKGLKASLRSTARNSRNSLGAALRSRTAISPLLSDGSTMGAPKATGLTPSPELPARTAWRCCMVWLVAISRMRCTRVR